MKKIYSIMLILILMFTFVSCNEQDLPLEKNVHMNNTGVANDTSTVDDAGSTNHTEGNVPETNNKIPLHFMIDGRLYVDTGETVQGLKCGVMDRNFDKVIPQDQIPSVDGEVNFESESNGAQSGRRENRLIACVDGTWRIFAYNENNLGGVTLSVKEASPSKLTVIFQNQLRKEFTYGAWFMIEQYDETLKEWVPVEPICEYAFVSVAYPLKAAKETEQEIKFDWLYGKLETGKYRVIKDVLDVKSPGDFDQYWLMAEFTIE